MKTIPSFSRAMWIMAPVTVLTFAKSAVAADIYIKIGDIKGEATDSQHQGWAEIQSFSWGVSNAGSVAGGGGGAGKATFKEFTVTKRIDKSSPMLLLACATGEHIPSVKLTVRRPDSPDGSDFYIVTFEDVLVSSYGTEASENTDAAAISKPPADSVKFSYYKVTFEYHAAVDDGTGPVIVTFDNTPAAGGTP